MWIKPRSTQDSVYILQGLAYRIADIYPSVFTHAMCRLVVERRYVEIAKYIPDIRNDAGGVFSVKDPLSDDRIEIFSIDQIAAGLQIAALFKKLPFLEIKNIDPKVTALTAFLSSELQCSVTNRFFRGLRTDPASMKIGDGSYSLHAILHRAARYVSKVLGACPSLDELKFEFGPGANTSVVARAASPRLKLGARLECSRNLLPTVGELLSEAPHWSALHGTSETEESWIVPVSVVPGKLQFVPKTSLTHRPIVVEPLLNSFMQKGVGSSIRRRLLKVGGLDLNTQEHNKKAAWVGSVDGSLATLDLSNASDTISTEFVRELLPPDWFELLDRCRSREVQLPKLTDAQSTAAISGLDSVNVNVETNLSNVVIRQEKFSSMGNGYTFELESLLFWALAKAVCSSLHLDTKGILVYGDDIIVPARAYKLLVSVLTDCGFTVNSEKSFHTGPFRESCGADYLSGFDVRPLFVKEKISDKTLFSMHNFFFRNGERELARYCEEATHPAVRIYGPDGYGDGHLLGTYSLRMNRGMKRAGWEGGTFDTYSLRPLSNKVASAGDSVLPVYSVYVRSGMESATDPFLVRGSNGYVKTSIYTLRTGVLVR